MSEGDKRPPLLLRLMWPALIVGALALIVFAIGWVFDAEHFYRAYLFAWLTCLGVALGSMSAVMLHHLTGGAWGLIVRRPAEAAGMTLPLLAVLFIPIAIAMGTGHLYPWADAGEVAKQAILKHRQPLFNPPFTIVRAYVSLAIWSFWAWRLRRLSLEHDRTADPAIPATLLRFSAFGFVVYFLTMSSAAVDWIASRETGWYSSTFGLMTITGQATIGTAFLIVALALLVQAPPLHEAAEPDHVHDLGNLLLTVTVLWAYVTFAQFLVIWIGNTQDDNIWYVHRTHGGWWWVGTSLIVLHFGVPFFLLLLQGAKRNIRILACIAGGVLVMRVVDVLWMVAPSSPTPEPKYVSWMDFVAPFALGGIWLACFVWLLKAKPLIPLDDAALVDPVAEADERQGEKRSMA